MIDKLNVMFSVRKRVNKPVGMITILLILIAINVAEKFVNRAFQMDGWYNIG